MDHRERRKKSYLTGQITEMSLHPQGSAYIVLLSIVQDCITLEVVQCFAYLYFIVCYTVQCTLYFMVCYALQSIIVLYCMLYIAVYVYMTLYVIQSSTLLYCSVCYTVSP